MKTPVIIGLLAGGMLCSSLALGHGGGNGKFMQFFDTNKDGVVTLDEFEAAMKSRFEQMDADHNGVISAEEFRKYFQQRRQERRQARLKQMDSNGDGQVSKDEFVAYQAKQAALRFARLDTNHDGMLSADEMDKSDFRHGHHGFKGLFRKLDTNGDGVVSLEESRAAWSAWFAKLDTNGDKMVTSDEVQAFREHRNESKAKQ